MQGLQGIRLPNGGVCMVGDIPQERCQRAGDKWPWQTPVMQGDVRCAVAWPERVVGHTYRRGCLALAVVDPDGRMRVIEMQGFDRVGTIVDERGRMVEGLARMMADVQVWGVTPIVVQCDNTSMARMWMEMIQRDSAMNGRAPSVEPAEDMDACMTVYKQMESMIIVPSEDLAEIGKDEASGIVNPMLRTVAMLASSYKMNQKRVQVNDRRWEAWI